MKTLPFLLLLLAACSSEEREPRQQTGGKMTAPAARSAPQAERQRDEGSIGSLVGLYESGRGERRNQMCVVKGKGGDQRFGLIVWGDNQHSCMGSGTVSREGDRLRLALAGDSACTIEATVSGKSVKLPGRVPQGCAYYCGARASLGGAELRQAGTTEDAAMRAKDIVGDPLCES